MCNIDDVSWGNRPSNSSGGLNIAVDDKKRQEIMRQNYRTTRTHILIWWLVVNVFIGFIIDFLVLQAVHNGNNALKATCQNLIWGYACYSCLMNIIITSTCVIHHLEGWFRLALCSRYAPMTIHKRISTSDPEAKILLDDTDEDEEVIPEVTTLKKNKNPKSRGKSNFETEENISYFSDDIETHQFMLK
jgi:hypothetical protein